MRDHKAEGVGIPTTVIDMKAAMVTPIKEEGVISIPIIDKPAGLSVPADMEGTVMSIKGQRLFKSHKETIMIKETNHFLISGKTELISLKKNSFLI